MLTTAQKAHILQRSGVSVPAVPAGIDLMNHRQSHQGTGSMQERPAAEDSSDEAVREWVAAVDVLFVNYAAARAAKSLRDAEEVRQLDALRRMAATHRRGARRTEYA